MWTVLLPCLKQGNTMAKDSGWPSSLTITLSRNQPQPPPRPSWPTRTLRTWPKDTDSMRNSSCWGKTGRKLDKDAVFPWQHSFIFHILRINDALTLPFSNLLTLFLLMIIRRSPVSPRSPITLRKTLASVPLPLTLPVQMVTRYFITEKDNREGHTVTYCHEGTGHYWHRFWVSAHTLGSKCLCAFRIKSSVCFLQGSGSSMSTPVAGSSLAISLSSSLMSSQRPHWKEYFSIVRVLSNVTCKESQPHVSSRAPWSSSHDLTFDAYSDLKVWFFFLWNHLNRSLIYT